MACRAYVLFGLVAMPLVLSGCHAPLWSDADVVFEGTLDPQGGDTVEHSYRFVLPEGSDGWMTCSRMEIPARTWYGFEDVHSQMPNHPVKGEGSCNEEISKLDPGPYTFFIRAPGDGTYRVALYFR